MTGVNSPLRSRADSNAGAGSEHAHSVQEKNMSRLRLILAGAAMAVVLIRPVSVLVQSGGDSRQPAGKDWPLTGGDWLNSRYSSLAQITPANVKGLRGAWATPLPAESSRATAVVQNGMLFVP